MESRTFEVEYDVTRIVLEHLRNQFNVHVLNVDLLYSISNNRFHLKGSTPYLQAFVEYHNGLVQLLLLSVSKSV